MRMKKLFKNIILTLIYQIVGIICGFIVPKAIIQAYGSDMNGLINSISQFLMYIYLAEGGIGAVVKSLLYRPIAEKDKEKIQKILKSAKKLLIQILGIYIIYVIVLCVFYPSIVSENFEKQFTIVLILVIAINRFTEYFMSMEYDLYLQANQQKYIISLASSIALIINTILTIIMIKMKFSIIYIKLVTTIIFIVRGIFYKIYVTKKYKIKLNKDVEQYPIKQRKDAFAHQIAYMIHTNVDVAVITYFLGTTEVSVYVVYTLVLKGIKNLVTAIMGGVDSLFGDMFAKNEYESATKRFTLYELIYFSIITILYNLCMILICPFVRVYTTGITDANYYRPIFAIIITISEFIWAIRYPFEQLINTVGHFRQTKKAAYTEAIINVIVSIILVNKLGIIGVAIGTVVAIFIRAIYMIWYFSKNILKRSIKTDFKFLFTILLQSIIITPLGIKICSNISIVTYFDWFTSAVIFGLIISLIIVGTNMIFNLKTIKDIYMNKRGKIK